MIPANFDDFTDLIAHQWILDGPYPLSTYPDLGPFVYYIQCGSFIKIGTSINPELRCDQLRRGGRALRPSIWVGNPKLIAYVPGNVAHERKMHKEFAAKRDAGEWFVLDDELVEHVLDIQQQQCSMELQVHSNYYEQMVKSGKWPAVDHDLAQMYQQHVTTKNPLDPEWVDAFAA